MNTSDIQHLAAALQPIAVSPSEAARLIGIGRTTIYSLIASGALASVKIGDRRLITIDAIKDLLAARAVKEDETGTDR